MLPTRLSIVLRHGNIWMNLWRCVSHEGIPSMCSISVDCWDDANRHKYLLSQKLGYDVGENAYDDWFMRPDCWLVYKRWRFFEYLHEEKNWVEFKDWSFARVELKKLLVSATDDKLRLFQEIEAQLKITGQNLGMLVWLRKSGYTTEADKIFMYQVLEIVDIDRLRRVKTPWRCDPEPNM